MLTSHTDKVKDADLTAEMLAAYAKNDQELMEELRELLNRNQQDELAQRLTGISKP